MKKQLQALGSNYAGVMKLEDGKVANFGSIRVEDENFIYYTGQGLREMFPQNGETKESLELKKLDEASLIKLKHIAITPVSEIVQIVS